MQSITINVSGALYFYRAICGFVLELRNWHFLGKIFRIAAVSILYVDIRTVCGGNMNHDHRKFAAGIGGMHRSLVHDPTQQNRNRHQLTSFYHLYYKFSKWRKTDACALYT